MVTKAIISQDVSVIIYIYIYIYIYIEECIFRQQVIIQASFVKEDRTLFVLFFSSLVVMFLMSESR